MSRRPNPARQRQQVQQQQQPPQAQARAQDPYLVPNLNLRSEPREKKVKSVTEALFIAKRRRKNKNPPSEAQQWANEIARKGLKTVEAIRDYFAQKLLRISDENVGFYKMIAESKVINNKLHLSDTLTNTPITCYLFVDKVKVKVITNDWLYLASCFKHRLNQLDQNDYNKVFYRDSLLLNVTYVSKAFNADWTYSKGYYQDFKDNFAAIGVETLTENERNTLLSGGEGVENFDFNYFGYDFTTRSLRGACIIAQRNNNNYRQDYNNSKIIKTDGKVSLNSKSIKINDKVKYIDSKVKPEKFCPAFLVMPEEIECAMLFKFKIDYNYLFEIVQLNARDNLHLPENFVYWDNMPQCFDFLAVLAVTSNIQQRIKDHINRFYDVYMKYKDVIDIWKKIQLDYSRILLDFYHSFQDKINIDKLNKINERVLSYIESRNQLVKDSSYSKVREFFQEIRNSSVNINRQFDEKVFALADGIKNITDRIAAGVKDDNLAADIREVAFGIYNVSLMPGTNNSFSCFNFIVSPGAFLSNIAKGVDDVHAYDPLQRILDNFNRRNERIQVDNNVMVNEIGSLYRNMSTYKKNVIRSRVTVFADENNYNLSQEELNNAVDAIYDIITNNREANKTLEDRIITSVVNGRGIQTVVISNNDIQNAINQIILRRQQAELERQQNLNELQMQNNEINTRINDLNSQQPQIQIQQQSQQVSSPEVSSIAPGSGDISTTTNQLLIPKKTLGPAEYAKFRNEVRLKTGELRKALQKAQNEGRHQDAASLRAQISELESALENTVQGNK